MVNCQVSHTYDVICRQDREVLTLEFGENSFMLIFEIEPNIELLLAY
jgi:frataxin-like iron-binding protein CyaY